MLSIYNGRKRSLGEDESKDVHLQISVKMRRFLHLFKGSALNVFLDIALHVDEQGWAWPKVTTIMKEAGRKDDAVYRALNLLCTMQVKGHRLMLRTKTAPAYAPAGLQDNKRNFYLFFPSEREVKEYELKEISEPSNGRVTEKDTSGNKGAYFEDTQNEDTENKGAYFEDTQNRGVIEEEPDSKEEPKLKEEPHTHKQNQPLPFERDTSAYRAHLDAKAGGVGVGSRFTLKECQDWARWRASQPDAGIRGADAVAYSRYRDGTADELIAEFQARTPEQIAIERSEPANKNLFYGEAAQLVRAMMEVGRKARDAIAEMPLDDDVRARLVAKFVTPESHGNQPQEGSQ